MGLEIRGGERAGGELDSLRVSAIVICGLGVAPGVGRLRIEEGDSSEVDTMWEKGRERERQRSRVRELFPTSPCRTREEPGYQSTYCEVVGCGLYNVTIEYYLPPPPPQ